MTNLLFGIVEKGFRSVAQLYSKLSKEEYDEYAGKHLPEEEKQLKATKTELKAKYGTTRIGMSLIETATSLFIRFIKISKTGREEVLSEK